MRCVDFYRKWKLLCDNVNIDLKSQYDSISRLVEDHSRPQVEEKAFNHLLDNPIRGSIFPARLWDSYWTFSDGLPRRYRPYEGELKQVDLPSTLVHIVLTESQIALLERYPENISRKIKDPHEWESKARQFIHFNEYEAAHIIRKQIENGEANRNGYAKSAVSLFEAFLRNYERVDLARSNTTAAEFSALCSLAIISVEENLEMPSDRLKKIAERLGKIVPYANKNGIMLAKGAVYRLSCKLEELESPYKKKIYDLFLSIMYGKGRSSKACPGSRDKVRGVRAISPHKRRHCH